MVFLKKMLSDGFVECMDCLPDNKKGNHKKI